MPQHTLDIPINLPYTSPTVECQEFILKTVSFGTQEFFSAF